MTPQFGPLIASVRDDVLRWLESARWKGGAWGRWPYNVHMVRPYGLIPSANGILLLQQLDALAGISDQQRREAIEYFQSAQDPRDGFFKDPLVMEADRVPNAIHSWEDIWGQMGIASAALRTLGAEPSRPLPSSTFADLRAVNVTEWVRNLGWKNPWHVGERFGRAVQAYVRVHGQGSDPVLDELFAAVEKYVLDPVTGYPLRGGCDNLPVAMAGLFKVMFGYLAAGRPVPNAEQAIDSTLALQRADGEFGEGRQMTINWDSLWVLRELNKQLRGGYRFADIRAAGNRHAELLLKVYRKPDGGFAFCGEHCWTVHHSIRIGEARPVSDTTGTGMCLRCLEYADEWNMGTTSGESHIS